MDIYFYPPLLPQLAFLSFCVETSFPFPAVSPSLCGRSAAHEPATSDGRSDGLQPFAVTAGAAASSPEPTPFYVFTWNSLSAISGLSPARPTGNSEHTCPSCPAGAGCPAEPRRGGCLRGGLLEVQWSGLFLPYGQIWWLFWEGGEGRG